VQVDPASGPRPALASLLGATVRRTLVVGRLYLALGTFISLLLALVLIVVARRPSEFTMTYPLEVPLFAVLGSLGGLMSFASDRTKGVFEYLIAYGVRPRTLFLNGLTATIALTALVLGASLAVGLGAAAAKGLTFTEDLWKSIGLYTVPMGFAGALFMATVGMIWSSVSTPRGGLNSPLGIAPMIGIGPTVLVLILAETAPTADFYYITGGAAAVIIAGVVALLVLSARLMGRERFLSPL
jgi:hypothetical protein